MCEDHSCDVLCMRILLISTIKSGLSCYVGIAFAVEPVCLLAKLNLHYETQVHYRTPAWSGKNQVVRCEHPLFQKS
jgi:hypothetical protein